MGEMKNNFPKIPQTFNVQSLTALHIIVSSPTTWPPGCQTCSTAFDVPFTYDKMGYYNTKGGVDMSNCIFCKIVNGELPSAKVFENDDILAFLDISQITKGHTLVIPKVHKEDIFEMDEETAGKLFSVVPEIAQAIKDEFNAKGMNLLNNNGSFAGQEVFHYHMHLIPRYDEHDGFSKRFVSHQSEYSIEDLQTMAAAISSKLK